MASELASNYSEYNSADECEDEETEQEAIKLIQSQVVEISALKLKLSNVTHADKMLQIQSAQMQSQQLQIQNLKAQIKIFEERFGGMELSFEASLNQAK